MWYSIPPYQHTEYRRIDIQTYIHTYIHTYTGEKTNPKQPHKYYAYFNSIWRGVNNSDAPDIMYDAYGTHCIHPSVWSVLYRNRHSAPRSRPCPHIQTKPSPDESLWDMIRCFYSRDRQRFVLFCFVLFRFVYLPPSHGGRTNYCSLYILRLHRACKYAACRKICFFFFFSFLFFWVWFSPPYLLVNIWRLHIPSVMKTRSLVGYLSSVPCLEQTGILQELRVSTGREVMLWFDVVWGRGFYLHVLVFGICGR